MATLDIRHQREVSVDLIRFYDECDGGAHQADAVMLYEESVVVTDSMSGSISSRLLIHDEEHARNLIRAVQKAIELGWFA